MAIRSSGAHIGSFLENDRWREFLQPFCFPVYVRFLLRRMIDDETNVRTIPLQASIAEERSDNDVLLPTSYGIVHMPWIHYSTWNPPL